MVSVCVPSEKERNDYQCGCPPHVSGVCGYGKPYSCKTDRRRKTPENPHRKILGISIREIIKKSPKPYGFWDFAIVSEQKNSNQRLLNWGARRAAFRPYYFLQKTKHLLVFLTFLVVQILVSPSVSPSDNRRFF